MKKIWLLALVVALVVASCGDGDGGDGGDGPGSVDVLLNDFEISPGSFEVTAGQEVEVTASNIGGINHSWVLLTAGPEVTTATDLDPSRILVTSGEVAAGGSAPVSFTAPAAGTYQVICSVPGHLEAGMTATLAVSG